MKLTTESEESINQFLNEVRRNLVGLSKEEQEDILENLRAHIYSELEKRSVSQLTAEDVQSVLNDMDPPEFYAPKPVDLSSYLKMNKKTSRRAIAGAVVIPIGFFLLLWFVPISSSTTQTTVTTGQIILRYTLLPLSIIAPFAATTLGLLGISEIRNSAGEVYGMPLAVFASLFYPILVLDLILIVLGWSIFSGIEGWDFIPVLWLALVLGLDYFIIRTVWRAANSPASP